MYYFLFGIILYSIFIYVVTRKNRILSELLGIIILSFMTFMIGLRYGVGIDYFNYETEFHEYYNKFTYEYLYFALRYIINIISGEFHHLTFIMILITNLFIYFGLKKREVKGIYLLLAIFIYSSSMALIFMNIMRQGVAIALFFYASTFIRDRNLMKYSFYMLIGAGFHLSIFFLFPLYFKPKITINKLNYLIGIALAYLFISTGMANNIINFIAYRLPFYTKYYNHNYLLNNDFNLLAPGVLLNLIFFYILLLYSNKDQEHTMEASYYKIGTVINILSISTFMFDRIGTYFALFGIVAIPKLIESIKNKNVRLIFLILALLLATIFFVQNLFVNPEIGRLEYKSIFSKP